MPPAAIGGGASLLAQPLVDLLAIRADRRSRLGLLAHGESLTAQRYDQLAHHGGFDDLVLLHVVEELRYIVIRRRIRVDFGALNRCRTWVTHSSPSCP